MDLKIGADPEIFLKNGFGDFISGHNIIPGSKYEPFRVRDGAVQVDGTALEFNIVPASTADEFVGNIKSVLQTLKIMVNKKRPDLRPVFEPTAYYKPAYFDTLPGYSKALGCEPDFDAYTGKSKTPPETKESFRTGSGHIHVGWTEDEDTTSQNHMQLCSDLVKNLDSVLYPMSHAWDDDRKRRELYGQKGSFRPKPYGVEYRVLSNAWLRDENLMRWVFDATEATADLTNYDIDINKELGKESLSDVGPESMTKAVLARYQRRLGDLGIPSIPEEYL